MTASRDPDDRIAAFFETTQPDLPDRTFEAIRRDIHRSRQRAVIGPWRVPGSFLGARYAIVAALVLVVGVVFLNLRPAIVPGGLPGARPTLEPASLVAPSAAASATASPTGPTVFRSALYDYTVTVPAGWIAAPAVLRWDGTRQPGPDAESDKFAGPGAMSAWAFAGPFAGDLAALVTDRIAATARDHADTCPVPEPEINETVQINDQPWAFLGWNCGALINNAFTVRDGIAYAFAFRDLGVRAAADPGDRALFESILDSVELPN